MRVNKMQTLTWVPIVSTRLNLFIIYVHNAEYSKIVKENSMRKFAHLGIECSFGISGNIQLLSIIFIAKRHKQGCNACN